jgi:hypothetical protein
LSNGKIAFASDLRAADGRTLSHRLMVLPAYVRIDSFCASNVGPPARVVTLAMSGETTVVESGGIFGIELDRLSVIGDSAVEFTLGAVGVATVIVVNRIFGIDPDCLAVIGDGAVVVALGAVGVAAVVVGGVVLGI